MIELVVSVAVDPWALGANSKDRVGGSRGRRWRYTTERHSDASAAVEHATRAAVARLGVGDVVFPSGPVRVEVTYRRARRSKAYGACGPFGDLDNPSKGVIDAVVRGGAMSDDVQIVELVARKVLADAPSVEIVVRSAVTS